MQFLEHDLHLLPVGGTHRHEMESLGILNLIRRLSVEEMRHGEGGGGRVGKNSDSPEFIKRGCRSKMG